MSIEAWSLSWPVSQQCEGWSVTPWVVLRKLVVYHVT